jgi:predicted NUDIX family NTP pyrophosphohydrolase
MPKTSAGLLPYRWRESGLQVMLVHPGGPFWAGKDAHAWSVAKGEVEPGEDLLAAARREFREETGLDLSREAIALAPVWQTGGKLVHAWAIEAEVDASAVVSNTFPLEWPPRSGRLQQFPEVDRAAWFDLAEACDKIHKGQIPLLDDLRRRLGG